MRKISIILIILLILLSLPLLGFGYKKISVPNNYYQVYFEGKNLGTIASKKELEDYISENGQKYKNKYNVDKVYAPQGVQIKKLVTYDGKVDEVSDIYQKIKNEEDFTVKGYNIKLKQQTDDKTKTTNIYVLNKKTFKDAVNIVINTFVGKDAYESYLNDTQSEIETTGKIIENVYVDEDITMKEEYF